MSDAVSPVAEMASNVQDVDLGLQNPCESIPPTKDLLPPNTTSRSSVRHAVSVMKGFCEYKRWLVNEIGFGGMLDLPMIQKLNLKLSSWIMSKVDVRQKSIVINHRKTLKFTSADVGMVFGIPSGNREVLGPDGNINEESISFIKKTLGMDLASSHSLRSAEAFLKRDITEQSSKIEKDCFEIAFVIFVMGHVLAPSCKHDYKSIDFWGALASAENIAQFNWCEYVMQCLLDAVTKLKMDIKNGVTTANLTGGHLFLQVFYLDNLDLGIFNKKHEVLPRIKLFDQDTLRQMATMATDVGLPEPSFSSAPLRDPSTVCYSRSRTNREHANSAMSGHLSSNKPSLNDESTATKTVPRKPHPNAIQQLSSANSPMQLSAMDYSNHIARHFPLMSKQPIAVLLREQNARAIRHVTTARHNIQSDMMNFTDKLFSTLASNCTCCAARGFSDCPLQLVNDSATPNASILRPGHSRPGSSNNMSLYRTPVSDKIHGVRLELSDDEESSSQRQGVLKRPRHSGSSLVKQHSSFEKRLVVEVPNHSTTNQDICSAAQQYARSILESIKDIYADCMEDDSSAVIFGVNCAAIPRRKYISSRSYASNPWFAGRPVVPGPTHTADLLVKHFPLLSVKHIARNWIVHSDPRFVRITGKDLQQQLLGDAMLDHELVCIILRRLKQLDSECTSSVPYLNHRHILEVDFSTLALGGTSISRFIQVQNQFVGNSVKHALEACQLFYITAILRDGWVVYIWDMLTRIIQVFDPSIGPKGCTNEKHR